MNFLQETVEAIKDWGRTIEDIKWVGTHKTKTSWDEFIKIADFEYDNGFGTNYITLDFIIVGSDWWMTREEYDGSECWCFQTYPTEPPNTGLTRRDIIDKFIKNEYELS